MPNRFKARVGEGFDPARVKTAIEATWSRLAEAVWEEFLTGKVAENGRGTREIWERQVASFWEVVWVLGEPETGAADKPTDGAWLPARKNWRSHWPPEEPGDHCTVMGDWQELSGHERPKHPKQPDDQKRFWAELRARRYLGPLELRPDERLCSIALIKRLFPKLSQGTLQEALGWVPGGHWRKVGNWPSTIYLAAAPWLQHVAENSERRAALKEYVSTVACGVTDEIFPRLAGESAAKLPSLGPLRAEELRVDGSELDALDGNYFLETSLANHRATPLSNKEPPRPGEDPDAGLRKKLIDALRSCLQRVGRRPLPFYSLLLMDGDRLGRLLGKHEAGKLSAALAAFTGAVESIVRQNDGFAVYAGGDDVFALLPVTTAVACARQLRRAYGESFQGTFGESFDSVAMTASCAVVFAHYRLPLRSVLREAHHQLDQVAKDGNGRDSLALALLKPEGITASWVNPWGEADQSAGPLGDLEKLVDGVAHRAFPGGFFHKLQARLLPSIDERGRGESPFSRDELSKLVVGELVASREQNLADAGDERAGIEEAATILLGACRHEERKEGGAVKATSTLQLSSGFLARFLAKRGMEEP